jgi:hypothetical protein
MCRVASPPMNELYNYSLNPTACAGDFVAISRAGLAPAAGYAARYLVEQQLQGRLLSHRLGCR